MKLYKVTLSSEIDARNKQEAIELFIKAIVSAQKDNALRTALQVVDVQIAREER